MGGRTKDVQNYIVAAYPDGTREVLFKPLSPLETPEALDKICFECAVALQKRFADPLVLIPVFIHDFLCIHPFVDGNGRMSRILTALLLCKAEFPVAKYVSLESKIEKTRGFYYNALARSGKGVARRPGQAAPLHQVPSRDDSCGLQGLGRKGFLHGGTPLGPRGSEDGRKDEDRALFESRRPRALPLAEPQLRRELPPEACGHGRTPTGRDRQGHLVREAGLNPR